MKHILYTLILLFISLNLFADGLIVPSQENYPYDLLKNKVTDVQVDMNGLVAETIVYQEFENEWDSIVDGVYSFPLPPNARATRLQYTVGDTLIDAVLKVQQQSTTPGTGSGGLIAEINKYMGNNVLSLALSNISAQGVIGVQLSYIQILKQFNGTYEYTYPLNTGDYVKHPLDYLKLRVNVNSSKTINSYDLSSHSDYQLVKSESNYLDIRYIKAKAYPASDFLFSYSVDNDAFDVDLYSWMPDTSDGYFAMVGKPQLESADSSLSQNLVFLLGNSSTMLGNKLMQSKMAIALALDELSESDKFNIQLFNSDVTNWKEAPVLATPANISGAKAFLDAVETESGNRLDIGLVSALGQLTEDSVQNTILAFTDGKSVVDPENIEAMNVNKTSICMLAIGDEIDRVRLEAVAALNYGFVAYVVGEDILANEMLEVFRKISHPLIKESELSFNDPGVYSLFPAKVPSVFAGSDFLVTGRYRNTGNAEIVLSGDDNGGNFQMGFQKYFGSNNELSRKLWAKHAIDDLEAQILIYGESDELKDSLIDLSLTHNIRCRYTAYVEDEAFFNDPDGSSWDDAIISTIIDNSHSSGRSTIVNNYPNPFEYTTVLKIEISPEDESNQKWIIFYDINGRVLKLMDISHLRSGSHEIVISREMLGDTGGSIIIAQLRMDNSIRSTIKMTSIQ